MKKVNIALKDEIHKKAKLLCVLRNIKLGDYLGKIIEDAVKKDTNIFKKMKGIKK